MKSNDYHIDNAFAWLEKAIKAVESHKNKQGVGYIRSSLQRTHKEKGIYPTATFQAYAALLESGKIDDVTKSYILSELKELLVLESYKEYIGSSTNNNNRLIILFEQILKVCSYVKSQPCKELDINPCIQAILEKLKSILGEEHIEERKNYYLPEAGRSPWFILSILNCQEYLERIHGDSDTLKEDLRTLHIDSLIDSHINYHMARYNIKELSFDPISLVIALCCKIKLEPDFKISPFFISCLRAVLEQQYSDGCWPTGATISFNDSGDVIQQASIQIASYLADSIVDYKFLVDCSDQVEEILDLIIPSFRKLFNYMTGTYEEIQDAGLSGWSSDRIKVKNYTETWITSYACRFLYKYWLAEKAYLRIKALKRLGVDNYIFTSEDAKKKEQIWGSIIEPDSILRPKEIITGIISPILQNRRKGFLCLTPDKDKVSFIICGPPGSGKTFIVEKMAEALGWPLVELSPSQFIKNGLDFIESTSKEIFNDLHNLYHAVIFFDECDELFRDRSSDQNSTSNRTILNFLTASMLPKLQKLHDRKNVIFVVGTNYLHNIDSAIRRKGRFDYRILWDRFDDHARGEYYDQQAHDDRSIDNKRDAFVKNSCTVLVKDLHNYIDTISIGEKDKDYIDWCIKPLEKEKKSEGDLELECLQIDLDKIEKKKEAWEKFRELLKN